MKKQNGGVVIYVVVACLIVIIIGCLAYLGVSHNQALKIAEIRKMEEKYKDTELVIEKEEGQKVSATNDVVPVYTPQQFALVGSGEEVYVEQEGKFYVFGTDKNYMFYGVAEEFTDAVKEQLSEQLKDEIKVEILEEGISVSAVRKQEPEAPRLTSNMVAVYWSKDGGTTASVHEEGASPIYSKIDANGNPSSTGTDNLNFKEENWYEYVEGYNLVDTKTSRWANGITDDGSYWVWIPRYKYKITNKPGISGVYSAGTVNVKFITVGEVSGTEGYITKRNDDGEFITEDNEGYIIHPAFEDGSKNSAKAQGHSNFVEFNNGEWDSELAGFWVAKYEASAENASGMVVEPGNVEISSTVKLVSKAGRATWRNITAGNSYKNGYNYNRANESHLIKNSEWGAVAFLTHSQYGRNGNEIDQNTDYISGHTGENCSTTGNVYGVYDMSGAGWENVAAWNTVSSSGALTSYGNVTLDGYTFGVSAGKSTKYATAYSNNSDTLNGVLAKEVCKIRRWNKRNLYGIGPFVV